MPDSGFRRYATVTPRCRTSFGIVGDSGAGAQSLCQFTESAIGSKSELRTHWEKGAGRARGH